MFGGFAILLRGNMCCGIVGEELMVRVGPQAYMAALELAPTPGGAAGAGGCGARGDAAVELVGERVDPMPGWCCSGSAAG